MDENQPTMGFSLPVTGAGNLHKSAEADRLTRGGAALNGPKLSVDPEFFDDE